MNSKDKFMYILGGVVVAGTFALLALFIYVEIPEKNEALLNISAGTLLTAFSAVVYYFYGSSKGSSDKTDLLKKP